MGTIYELFDQASFDPETLKLLCDAYDRANKALHDAGRPNVVNEVMAQRIIALAKQGERDPERLVKGALKGLGNKAE